MAGSSLGALPPDLPVPEDDGAARGVEGRLLPSVRLPSSLGSEVDLRAAGEHTVVVYVYPRTGVPGEPVPAAWDAIPGARGCTPENCAFRDLEADFRAAGAQLMGLSAQPAAEQRDFALREGIGYPLLNDGQLVLAGELGLPTFEFEGRTLYRRLTFVAEEGRIVKVFYPVFPPDRHAGEVLAWLSSRRDGG